jgi:hypothetical protein
LAVSLPRPRRCRGSRPLVDDRDVRLQGGAAMFFRAAARKLRGHGLVLLAVQGLEDRPPFLDFGFMPCTERVGCLLFAWKRLNAVFRKSRPHHGIGQRIDNGGGEPGDHVLRRSLGRPEPAPTDIVEPRYPGLVDRWNVGCRGEARLVGDGKGLDDPRANVRSAQTLDPRLWEDEPLSQFTALRQTRQL